MKCLSFISVLCVLCVFGAHTAPAAIPHTNAIRGWWQMDTSDAPTPDSSANTNAGAFTGANITWTNNARQAGGFMLGGSSSADDGWFDCGNDSSLNITAKTLTVSAWIKPATQSRQWMGVISKANNSFTNGGFCLYLHKDEIKFFVADYPIHEVRVVTNLLDGKWHHVAGAYDGTNVKIYVDGSLMSSAPYNGVIGQVANNFWIGKAHGGYNFYGRIDEVIAWEQALSASDTLELYQSYPLIHDDTPPGPVTNLAAQVDGVGTSIILDWTGYDEDAQGGDIAFYTIYSNAVAFTYTANAQAIGTAPAGAKTFQVSGLIRGVTGHYAVVATDITGLADSNVTSIAAAPRDAVAPPDPTNMTFTCFETNLIVAWSDADDPRADLAGYRVYINNVLIADLPKAANACNITGLTKAAGYAVKITSYDNDNNESGGIADAGYTLYDNPTNIVAAPYSGMVTLTWDAAAPGPQVLYYAVYVSESDFTNVAGITRATTRATTGGSVAGLRNGVTNYFAVTMVNLSKGEQKAVATISAVPQPDTTGPAMSNIRWENGPLSAPITGPGRFTLNASDPAGVSRVEFKINGATIATETGAGLTYSGAWNVSATTNDGTCQLDIIASDTLGNSSTFTTNVTVALAAPQAPAITSPVDGTFMNKQTLTLSGDADQYADTIVFYMNGSPTGVAAEITGVGRFSGVVALTEGTNRVQAAAVNRAGEGTKSSVITVTLDTSIPDAPLNVNATALSGGEVLLNWSQPIAANVKGYNLYRAQSSFTETSQAVRVNAAQFAGTSYRDLPENDGTNYYRVTTLNMAGAESQLSREASVVSDGTSPRAVSIRYTTDGRFDPTTNRYAAGNISLAVAVSEKLLTMPFLSIVPNQGAPIPIELKKTSDTNYTGSFKITEATPSGIAYLNFSGRDVVGNRGTAIDAGGSIIIDTAGPVVAELLVTPGAPIKNDPVSPTSVVVVIGFDAADVPTEPPVLRYTLSVSQTNPAPITFSPHTESSWTGVFTLSTNAGETPEYLAFSYSGVDDLANTGTVIREKSSFQVYQGALPPLASPTGLAAQAMPGGRVRLAWNAVQGAGDYQVYRQAPGETSLAFRAASAGQLFLLETAPDGTNRYAVASAREANNQQSISALSDAVSVVADSVSPGAPGNVTLALAGNGIRLTWRPPAGAGALAYSLYRSTAPITTTSVENISALIAGISATNTVDPAPLQGQAYYAVTALDPAGNESAPSESVYTNLSLLPVNTLEVARYGNEYPVVSWTHAAASAIAGYNIYVGAPGNEIKLNASLLPPTATAFDDTGYDGADRRYTVRAVDIVGGAELESVPRSIILPRVSAAFAGGATLKRGVMNRLNYLVTNQGKCDVSELKLKVIVGGNEHVSQTFSLAAGASNTVAVVVGGYAGLPAATVITNTLEVTPNAGEKVVVTTTAALDVGDDALTAELLNDEFTRGGVGKARFALHNTCAEEIEIVMARSIGAQPSDEVRFKLQDADGSVFSVASAQQSTSEGLFTLGNGVTVARIAPGASFTSADIAVPVPTNAPDTAVLRLEIDRVHYHYGYSDQVSIAGLASARQLSLADMPYLAEVTNVTPAASFGAGNIVITGRTIDKRTNVVARAPVKLTVSLRGFERAYNLYSDLAGNWSYTFAPEPNESGIYSVWALHPDSLDKPVQATFSVNRVTVSPLSVLANLPRNYEQKIPLTVTASEGLTLTNLHLEYNASDQPGGVFPQGVHVGLPAPIPIFPESPSAIGHLPSAMPITLWGDNSAATNSTVVLRLTSAGASENKWALVTISNRFSIAAPSLYWRPGYVETGVAISNSALETITLENNGLAALEGVELALLTASNTPAPGWVFLNSAAALGDVAVGEKREVGITFAPTGGVAVGAHEYKLRVTSANYRTNDIALFVTADQSGKGAVLFHVSDLFTGYDDGTGVNAGVGGAAILLRKQEGSAWETNLVADANGEAWFRDLPVGRYNYGITAPEHAQTAGNIWLKPGITLSEEVFMEYNLVTVEWEVVPTVIEDFYEIALSATFETDVPAPVIVCRPPSATLPDMEAGDVFNGEFLLENHGLIRAYDLSAVLPGEENGYRFELLTQAPDVLEARESARVAYRITRVSAPEGSEGGASSSPMAWVGCITAPYKFKCASGSIGTGAGTYCVGKGGSVGGSGAHVGIPPGWGKPWIIGPPVPPTGLPGTSIPPPTAPATPITGAFCPPNPCKPPSASAPCVCAFPGGSPGAPPGAGPPGLASTPPLPKCWVDLFTGSFEDYVGDISVKVAGGSAPITRLYRDKTWQFNYTWVPLAFEYGLDNKLKNIVVTGVKYEKANPEATVFTWGDNRVYVTGSGYRWEAPGGDWSEFDQNGLLIEYGDRNNVKIRLIYDATNNWIGVQDHFTNQVLWIARDAQGRITQVSDAATGGRTVTYSYDAAGNLTNVVNARGYSARYEYDAENRIVYAEHANGLSLRVKYAAQGYVERAEQSDGVTHSYAYGYDSMRKTHYAYEKISATTGVGKVVEKWFDAEGNLAKQTLNGETTYDSSAPSVPSVVEYSYDPYGNITKIAYPDGTFVTREYESKFFNVTREVNELGIVTEYKYDSAGNLTNKVEAAGTDHERVTSYTYDALGNLSSYLSPCSSVFVRVEHSYDQQGNLIQTRQLAVTESVTSVLSVVEHSYDNLGNILTITDPRGNVTSNTYDNMGNLLSSTLTINHQPLTILHEYDSADNRIRQTDAGGRVTQYEYDLQRRVTLVSNSLGEVTASAYDFEGNLIRQETLSSATSALSAVNYSYDPFNRLLSETTSTMNHQPSTILYEYDADGRLIRVTDPEGNVTETQYDPATGQVAKEIHPTFTREYQYDLRGRIFRVLSRSFAVTNVSSFTYDAVGNVLSRTDAEGRATLSQHDDFGRNIASINALGHTNRFEYDMQGNLTRLTDANGNETAFEYDAANRLTRKTYADGTFHTYAYDPSGNLTNWTDAKGQVTTYEYDALSRIIRVHPRSSAATSTVSYSYDIYGRMTSYSDGTTSGAFIYDDTNRARTVTLDYGPFTKSYTYQYDAYQRKSAFIRDIPSLEGPGVGSTTNTYSYTADGRLASITLPGEGAITFGGYRQGQLTAVTLPGGTTKSFGYDPFQSMTTNVATDAAGNSLMSRIYQRNAVHNITGQQTEHGNYAYQYDAGDQLTRADHPTLPDETFTYDPMGNRLSVSSVSSVVEYNVNNLNQYTNITKLPSAGGVGGGSFLYDANGNMTKRVVPDGDGSWTTNYLAWNIENRLTEVLDGSSNTVARYWYDPFGRRVKKEVYIGSLTNVTWFMYSDEGLVAEFDATGSVVRTYGYVPGSLWMNNPFYMEENGARYYYLNDHLGAPQEMVNKNGAVVWSMLQESFGQATVWGGSVITNSLRFSSQYLDEESGLHYNTFRYYDPALGRYTRIDPVLERGFWSAANFWELLMSRSDTERKSLGEKDVMTSNLSDGSRWFLQVLPYAHLTGQRAEMVLSDRALFKNSAYAFVLNNPVFRYDPLGLDCPGCDKVGWVPGSGSKYALKCCAKHDECYYLNKCSWSSWLWMLPKIKACLAVSLPPILCTGFPITKCDVCNVKLMYCFAGGIDPGGKKYFCARVGEYIDIGEGKKHFDTIKEAEACCCTK